MIPLNVHIRDILFMDITQCLLNTDDTFKKRRHLLLKESTKGWIPGRLAV